MEDIIEQTGQAFRSILKKNPGIVGRKKICTLLKRIVLKPEFVSASFPLKAPRRKVLYEDPELGFCIVAHYYKKRSVKFNPHDHGFTWVIYAQVYGEAEMTDWNIICPASKRKDGLVSRRCSYRLTPGDVRLYNEGEVHSPLFVPPVRYIRIEGSNLEKIKRGHFEIL